MRWLIFACCIISLRIQVAEGQETRIVRKWKGDLGRSQFGVFSKDGSRLVYTKDNDVFVVDTETGENAIQLSGHEKPVWAARFSGDDKRMVSVGQDESIRVWDTASNKQISQLSANTFDRGSVLAVSKDAKLVAFSTGENRMLRVMNMTKEAELQRIGLTENEVDWKCVTPDGRFGMSNGIRNQTQIWDLNTGVPIEIDNGHHNYAGQFTHDGTQAMLAGAFSWDLWDIRRKAKLKSGTVTGGHIYAIATSPNTSRFMTGLADGTVWLWDVKTGRDLLVFRGHEKAVDAVMISPDKKFAVSRDSSGEIILWRLPK